MHAIECEYECEHRSQIFWKPLELELLVTVSFYMRVLGTEVSAFSRAVCVVNQGTIYLAPIASILTRHILLECWGSNSGLQTFEQVALPIEPAHQVLKCHILEYILHPKTQIFTPFSK